MLYPDHRLCLWEIYKDKLQNLADTVEEDLLYEFAPRKQILQMSESYSIFLMVCMTSLTLTVKSWKSMLTTTKLYKLTCSEALTLGVSACVLKSSADFITVTTRTSLSSNSRRLFLFTTRNRLCSRGRKTLRASLERGRNHDKAKWVL